MKKNIDSLFKLISDYDDTVGKENLIGNFKNYSKVEYDIDKISKNWNAKKGDFIGTNCRINSFMLLKDSITMPNIKSDDSLLYLDNDVIDKTKIFNSIDKTKFQTLF